MEISYSLLGPSSAECSGLNIRIQTIPRRAAEVLFRLLYVVFGLRQAQAVTRTFAEISLMRLANHAAPFEDGETLAHKTRKALWRILGLRRIQLLKVHKHEQE